MLRRLKELITRFQSAQTVFSAEMKKKARRQLYLAIGADPSNPTEATNAEVDRLLEGGADAQQAMAIRVQSSGGGGQQNLLSSFYAAQSR
jgi:t-SNARE complex subunit (syntaxin)